MNKDFVLLDGSARDRWRRLGAIQGRILRNRVDGMHCQARRAGWDVERLRRRGRIFADNVARVAPHWLDEVEGLSRGADVFPGDVYVLNCLPPDFEAPSPYECTAFAALGERYHQLFKIRDTRNLPQIVHVQTLATGMTVQIGGTVGTLGAGHAVNARGVAGACNTGSHTTLVDDSPRFDDCHVLRYLVESVDSVKEIPGLYAHLLEAGLAAGAEAGRGALYVFVDRERGLLLEAAGPKVQYTWLGMGCHVVSNHFLGHRARTWWSRKPNDNTLLRRRRLQMLTATLDPDRPNPTAVFALSRDRDHAPHALCNDDSEHVWMTVSAQLQIIDRHAPDASVNWVCCGNTAQSVYVPVNLNESLSFVPWADGRFYSRADKRYRTFGCGSQFRARQEAFERAAVEAGVADFKAFCRKAYRLLGT